MYKLSLLFLLRRNLHVNLKTRRSQSCVSFSSLIRRLSYSNYKPIYGTKRKQFVGCVLPLISLNLPNVDADDGHANAKDDVILLTKKAEINQPKNQEDKEKTGWDRLCDVYKLDEFGNFSKELNAAFQGTCMACIIGILYGGVTSSREALIDFMERNQATIFDNPIDAKRRLQNHVTIHFAKGAFHWMTKLSLFTGSFMLFLLSMSAYRGETSVIDYTLSGTVTGAVLRLRLGPRGLVIGGIVGGFLGLFCGVTSKTLLNLYGSSLDDIISFQYEIEKRRKNLYKEAMGKEFEKHELNKEMVDLIKNRNVGKEE